MFDLYPDLEPDDANAPRKTKLDPYGCVIPLAGILGAIVFATIVHQIILWWRGA